ncbi:MAG: SDR family NAD(P)-dependent oxidoreductase [Methanomassiliicoccus sp.]|nr:SDR family NAD(P)-dependent oxidoreductase [Methanomassiliicoccus sp.]
MRRIDELTVLVTGSTDGIGRRSAHGLASQGAKVLVHGRSLDRGRATVKEITAVTGNVKVEYYNADFSALTEVRRLATEVARDHPRLDVLVNNAGIGAGKKGGDVRELSADGFELRFAVNYLAPFLLTHLLLPVLRESSPSRIVNVSSLGQSPLDLADIMLEHHYDSWNAYGQSKLALVMFTFDLAERIRDETMTVNALSPGSLLDTKMVREWFGRGRGDVQQGADAVMNLATSPRVEGVTGRFFDREREARANDQAYDRRVRKELYRISCRLTGLERPLIGEERDRE